MANQNIDTKNATEHDQEVGVRFPIKPVLLLLLLLWNASVVVKQISTINSEKNIQKNGDRNHQTTKTNYRKSELGLGLKICSVTLEASLKRRSKLSVITSKTT